MAASRSLSSLSPDLQSDGNGDQSTDSLVRKLGSSEYADRTESSSSPALDALSCMQQARAAPIYSAAKKTDAHEKFVRDFERHTTNRCWEADQILGYLRAGKPYRLSVTFDTQSSSDLFDKMSKDISRLSQEKATMESQVQKLCSLIDRYAKDHERRKQQRIHETETIRKLEQEKLDLCLFVHQLFARFVKPGEPVTMDNIRELLVTLHHKIN
jgi:hypothetical protein